MHSLLIYRNLSNEAAAIDLDLVLRWMMPGPQGLGSSGKGDGSVIADGDQRSRGSSREKSLIMPRMEDTFILVSRVFLSL